MPGIHSPATGERGQQARRQWSCDEFLQPQEISPRCVYAKRASTVRVGLPGRCIACSSVHV